MLRAHELALRAGWDRVHRGARDHGAVLRPLHAGHLGARLRAPAAGRSSARSTSSRCCALDRAARARGRSRSCSTRTCPTSRASAPGRSARSGSGRRWRACTCRCSTLLDGAPVTLGLTPVLCDQLEAMRGDAGERYLRFLRDVRAPIHAEDAARARRDRRAASSPPRCAGRRATTRAPSAPSRSAGATSSPPSRALERRGAVDLRRHARAAAADGHRRRPAAPGRDRHGVAPAALRRRGEAASGCRSARTCPGSSATLAEHGVRAFCVDQTARAAASTTSCRWRPRPGPVAVPIDWELVELVWHDERGYPAHGDLPQLLGPHRPRPEAVEQRRAALRPRRRARARPRARARLRGAGRGAGSTRRRPPLLRARHRAARALVVRGARPGSRPCSRRRSAQGVRLVTVSEGIELVEPVERAAGRLDLGARQGLHDLGRPARWPSSPSRRARPSSGPWRRWRRTARRTPALERAARELLAMQASDWSFMVTRDLAGRLPGRAHARARRRPGRRAGRSDRLREPPRTRRCAVWRLISTSPRSRLP